MGPLKLLGESGAAEQNKPVRRRQLLGSERRLPDLRRRRPYTSPAQRGVLPDDLLRVTSYRSLLHGENCQESSDLKGKRSRRGLDSFDQCMFVR